VLSLDHSTELRWISLPRVSGPDTKRPDHVFQLFIDDGKDIILSIESKETPQSLETGIGPRLTAYLTYLFSSPASIEKQFETGSWRHSDQNFVQTEYRFASAGAFLATNREKVLDAANRSDTDLTFALDFSGDGKKCSIELIVGSQIGDEIADNLLGSILSESNICLKKSSII
jgi:hypothetical protein